MPFAVGAIMGEIFFNIDNVMISKMVGMESVGYYNAAYKLSYSGILFANTMTLAIYPYLSKNWLEDKDKVFSKFGKFFKILIILSMAFLLTAFILSNNVIVFVFGKQFNESIVLFQILVFSLPPLCLMHLTNRTLDAIGEQRFKAKTMVVGVIINVVLNFILIYKLNAIGASIATVATSILIITVHIIYLRRRMGFTRIEMPFIKISICLIVMVAMILLLKDYNWLMAAFIGLTTYCGLIFLLKVLKREDILVLARETV
jgi:O-antigen/teichoic acid export membrane protein